MPTETPAASILGLRGAGGRRSSWACWPARSSWAAWARSSLWGKREQRASAEAIDTVDHNHWLVAQIQGRPRLEKPPLPRWSIAALMMLTGRRDEWIVRLPGALVALATVALIYALGSTDGGP